MFKYILLTTLLLICVATDYKTYKIKNKFILPAVFIAFIYYGLISGMEGMLMVLIGLLIPIICLFPLFVLKMIPAGDIKLIGTIGAIMGLGFTINAFIYSIILAGIGAIILGLKNRVLIDRLKYLVRYISLTIRAKQILHYNNFDKVEDTYQFPLAAFIAIGCLVNGMAEHAGYYIFWS